MIRAALLALLLAVPGCAAPAVAKPSTAKQTTTVTMGGIENVMCGSVKGEADDEKAIIGHAETKDTLKVNRLNKDAGKKFIAQLNAEGAGDDPTGPLVAERVIMVRGPTESLLMLVSHGRLCIFPAASNEAFDKSLDAAFGSGS